MKFNQGQHIIEYVVIILTVAIAVVLAMYLLRSQINFLFNQISLVAKNAPAK